ncbi:GIY-YIG nuclease family protein [Salimicrobium flavidum]|uniref:Putative endonuclease n=1 Tax=Salimicrobium flavidum TaxID=570947 RepID=A0A1N7KLM2_9BACI|nr:GIY-YIG nuclease family protein [Salimicrobium flavidum]SIS62330.1 putative endonuclease [Salimicrobium flavidum]
MGDHVVYMLKCRDGTFYTGYTNNLSMRLRKHESGQGAKYTRGRGPFQVVFTKHFPTKSSALKEEYRIKRLNRPGKEELIREGTNDEDTKEFSGE